MRCLLPLLAMLCLHCEQPGSNTTEAKTGTSYPAPDTSFSASSPDYDTTEWAELIRIEPTILLDLRYATDNNFTEAKMYGCGRCFLRPAVARAVVAAHRQLQKQGLGLKMFDCYRPRPVQEKLWNMVPDPRYVADPRDGSMHNRGAAADLTIVDSTGRELDMGTGYDFFGQQAHHDFAGLPDAVIRNRQLLKTSMAEQELKHINTEWWHYSFQTESFPVSDWEWKCKGNSK